MNAKREGKYVGYELALGYRTADKEEAGSPKPSLCFMFCSKKCRESDTLKPQKDLWSLGEAKNK